MSDLIPYGTPLPADVLTVDHVTDIRRRLNFDMADWVRNAHRCLSGIVQEQTQGETVDLDHLRGDAAGALRAVEQARGELDVIAATLRPFTRMPARESVERMGALASGVARDNEQLHGDGA